MYEQISLFVTGRLCLFGEHSDWAAEHGLNNGYCITIGTDQGLHAFAEPSTEFVINTVVPHRANYIKPFQIEWIADRLLEVVNDKTQFFRYCAGVAYYLLRKHNVPGGLKLLISKMDLPIKKGVASSAAVCVLIAKAFNAIYGLGLSEDNMMDLAYHGERITGSACGRMDQTCIYGNKLLFLTFSGKNDVLVAPFSPKESLYMFFIDLGGKKNTSKILRDLHCAYRRSTELQQALGKENERIVRSAKSELLSGNIQEVGRLMTEAQQIFDKIIAPFSPNELKSPLLHSVLSMENIQENIYGGKGAGSQGDGVAQFIARGLEDREVAIRKIRDAFPKMKCYTLDILTSEKSGK